MCAVSWGVKGVMVEINFSKIKNSQSAGNYCFCGKKFIITNLNFNPFLEKLCLLNTSSFKPSFFKTKKTRAHFRQKRGHK
jgi:hypothetical protein